MSDCLWYGFTMCLPYARCCPNIYSYQDEKVSDLLTSLKVCVCEGMSSCFFLHVHVQVCGGQRSTMGVVSCEPSNLFFEIDFY